MERGVSIIIPYHGQYSLLRRCLESIISATKIVPYEIILVDDGSKNKTFFKSITNNNAIRGIQLPEQKGFGAALNAGIRTSKRPWICFLNSDCRIQETSWLISLYNALINGHQNKIGMVSAVMDHPGIYSTLQRERFARGNIVKISEEPLPLICALCSRGLLEKTGQFKEYPYGYFEDEFFYWKMRKLGYRQAIVENSWVHHEGGATIRALWKEKPEAQTIMCEENYNRCAQDIKIL